MIAMEYGKFTLICDVCGEEVQGFDTFDDALDYKTEEGWRSKQGEQLDLKEGWVDVCPSCLKK